jgi:DeoR/GlpR family transcriptional regulator of sugar metabolism
VANIDKRRSEIVSLLYAMQKELKVEDLSAILEVSPATVRRYLKYLQEQNIIIRTHGGCIVGRFSNHEDEYQKKVRLNFKLKNAIGKTSVKIICQGENILIDDSSTTFHFASQLGGRGPLSVFTNSFPIVSALSQFPDLNLYMFGGKYTSDYSSLTGEITERTIESFVFDHVIIGAAAINDDGRCFAGDQVQARLNQVMIRSGRSIILLADHTKVNAKGMVSFGTLRDFDTWITTPGIECSNLQVFRKMTDVIEAGLS